MPYSYEAATSAPALHRGAACLECRRRKLKCDGVRPVCGCCERGRRPGQCTFDPPEGRVFGLQQRIRELEESIRVIEAQPRRSRRSSPQGAAVQPQAAVLNSSYSQHPTYPSHLMHHRMPVSVDWSACSPNMGFDSPTLSSDVYEPSTSTGPFRHGRSGEEWLFNAPLGSLAGPVDTDPFTAVAHLALMPSPTPVDAPTASLLSSPMHDFLIASFMARRREYGLYVDEENFLTSFALPPDHPSAVHPALRNAVYLLACRALNSQTPALAQFEPSFVDKVRQGIADALEAAYRDNSKLFSGVILASTLLARYLLIMGRIREAYHQTASVARFAVSCGLHQISSLDLRPHSPSSRTPPLLPPATDYVALGERIHAFWAIYALDRTLVVVAGLPSTFGDDGSAHVDACERITTMWPRPLREYRSPETLAHVHASSIADYFAVNSQHEMRNGRPTNPSVCTLTVQAMEIHHRAHEALHRPDSATSTRLSVLGRSALQFLRDVPTLDYFDDNDSVHAGCNPSLVEALALVYVAQIKIALVQHGRAAYGDQAVQETAARISGLMRRAQASTGLSVLVGVCCTFTLGFQRRASRADALTEQLERSLAQLRIAHIVLADPHLEIRDLL